METEKATKSSSGTDWFGVLLYGAIAGVTAASQVKTWDSSGYLLVTSAVLVTIKAKLSPTQAQPSQ